MAGAAVADPITSAARAAAAPGIELGDPEAFRRLLVSRGAPAAADDETLLRLARAPEHKLAVTLLSAWQAAGRTLQAAQLDELAEHRGRIARYRSTWPVVKAAAPDAHLVKGMEIASRYPPGLLREAGDLDVICPAGQLWPAAQVLIGQGWELGALAVLNARTPAGAAAKAGQAGWEPDVSVALYQPSDTSIADPYEVELRTVDVATSLRLPVWRLAGLPLPPVAASVLALAAERWERPFRSRDIYDLAVLAGHLGAAELAGLRAALTVTGLWPEFRELAGLLGRSGLRPPPQLPGARLAALRARLARAARAAGRWGHPVRVLGYLVAATVDKDRGKLADWLAKIVHERIGTWRLLRLGLPLFTVPLSAPPAAGDAMRLARRGPHLVAVTPAGSFLLVAGSCQEAWLREAATEAAADR
jgi:hypothetical protein